MINLFKVFMSDDTSEVNTVLKSGFITQGEKVEKFETELKKWFNYEYILTVNSATNGLTLALRLLNLNSEDEVLSSPLTCVATNMPILANNLKIKWVDVDPDTCNMDLTDLSKKISEKTKAIMIVHWGGSPIDMERLQTIVKNAETRYNTKISIIEDCAHSFSSKYVNGEYVGTTGNIAVYSLQAIKHLTTGDGGLIFLPNQELYERAKLLRWFGIDRNKRTVGKDLRMEENIKEWGYKYHMNDINATIGLCNLPHMDRITQLHKDNAAYYNKELQNLEGVKLMRQYGESSYWIYTIGIVNKQGFIEYMKEKNVMVSQVHNRNDIHECFKEFKASLPQLDKLEKSIICIPVGWWVTERNYIVDCIKDWSSINSITIRELQEDDDYLSLLSKLTKVSYNLTKEEFWAKYNLIKQQGGRIVVACNRDRVVGGLKVQIEQKFKDNVAHIEDVIVDVNFRQSGIGKKLLKKAVEYSTGCYKIVLSATEELDKFYTQSGFVNTGGAYTMRLN